MTIPRLGLTSPSVSISRRSNCLRKSTDVLSILFAYRPADKVNIVMAGVRLRSQRAGEYVSGDYFRGLNLAPAAGRLLIADDDRPTGSAVVVLSYAFAQNRFGDAASAAGRQLLINNVPFTAVGVTPPGFFGVDPAAAPEVYLPMHADLLLSLATGLHANPAAEYLDQHYYWIEMMGRLRPGISMERAQAALAPVFEGWVATTAANDAERKNLPEFLLKRWRGRAGITCGANYAQPLRTFCWQWWG